MKVAVIGTGYVGLVVGAGLAETGNDVICVDIDRERIKQLKKGVIPIFEPGLERLVLHNTKAKRLHFTTDTKDAVERSEIIFLAVPTPMDEDGSADLQHVLNAAKEVAAGINGYKVIIDKSTVPVGTAKLVKKVISENTNQPFDVVSNPEFLKEGAAVSDFMKPDRIVIGSDSERAEKMVKELYAAFQRTGYRVVAMRIESAELTKYAANAFLATKVSFINEIARLCDAVGADVTEVRMGVGSDKRIGNTFLFPGMGFGGSCFPKDLRALDYTASSAGIDLNVVKATLIANDIQKQVIPNKILSQFGSDLSGLHFTIWGLAFKANTDDIRESPALTVIDFLLKHGASVTGHDPEAMPNTRKYYGKKIKFEDNNYDALENSDALIIATEWNEYRRPDYERVKNILKQPVIFDGRNLYDPMMMRDLGFKYYAVGRVV